MKTGRNSALMALAVCALIATQSLGEYSVGFATGDGYAASWTVTVNGGAAVLSFDNNMVYTCSPSPDPVLGDLVGLPDMLLSNIQTTNLGGIDILTADITPNGDPLTLTDTAAGLVMSASVDDGGLLTVGTNFIAYSNQDDDLDVTYHNAGYSSSVINGFAALDGLGYDLDLSFGGDVSASLYDLLDIMADGSVSGTMSGQIVAIPEPVTLSLLAVGGIVLIRKRT